MVFHFKKGKRNDPSFVRKEPQNNVSNMPNSIKRKSSLRKQRSITSRFGTTSFTTKINDTQRGTDDPICADQGVTYRNKTKQTTKFSVSTSQTVALNNSKDSKTNLVPNREAFISTPKKEIEYDPERESLDKEKTSMETEKKVNITSGADISKIPEVPNATEEEQKNIEDDIETYDEVEKMDPIVIRKEPPKSITKAPILSKRKSSLRKQRFKPEITRTTINDSLFVNDGKDMEDGPKRETTAMEQTTILKEEKGDFSNSANNSEILEFPNDPAREQEPVQDNIQTLVGRGKLDNEVEKGLQDEKINIFEPKMLKYVCDNSINTSPCLSHDNTQREYDLNGELCEVRRRVDAQTDEQRCHQVTELNLVQTQSIKSKRSPSYAPTKIFEKKEDSEAVFDGDSNHLRTPHVVRWDIEPSSSLHSTSDLEDVSKDTSDKLQNDCMETWETLDEALRTMSETHDTSIETYGSSGSVSTQQVNSRSCCCIGGSEAYDGEYLNASRSTYDMTQSFSTYESNESFSTYGLGSGSSSAHDLNASKSSKFRSIDSGHTTMTMSTMGDDDSVESFMSLNIGCGKVKVYIPNPVHAVCLSREKSTWLGDVLSFGKTDAKDKKKNTKLESKATEEAPRDSQVADELPRNLHF